MKFSEALMKTRGFSLPFAFFLFVGSFLLLFIERGDVVVFFNAMHSPGLDQFWKYATYLGDGVTLAVIVFIILLSDRKLGTWAMVTVAISMLLNAGLKNIFRAERPPKALENLDLHFIPGVELHYYMSFPSGHTGAAFTGFFMLSIASLYWPGARGRTIYLSLIFFILALIAGLSRIWLGLHFFEDVFVGATMAFVVCLFTWVFASRRGFLPQINTRISK